ncbi:trimethyllysine dioxygenase [Paraphysoderma sedebokerense]|nr:trimethyllysine dioxygenase [Paraphysoderma sedebokerense]
MLSLLNRLPRSLLVHAVPVLPVTKCIVFRQKFPHIVPLKLYNSVKHKTTAIANTPVVSPTERELKVEYEKGIQSKYLYFWLRDHCRCEKCYHSVTKQRLLDVSEIPLDIKPKSTKVDENKVVIVWPDNHTSTYELQWLKKHSYAPALGTKNLEPERPKILWESTLASNPPTIEYKDVMNSDDALGQWLINIDTYGFSFVKGVPATPADTQKLAERICFIRPSHYGGFWDFTSNLAHGDTAYTQLALGAHTDTTYFTDPIGLQLFHLLEFKGIGGESLLVDGFAVASQLKKLHPESYETLSTIPIATHSAGDVDTYIFPTPRYRPILAHRPHVSSSSSSSTSFSPSSLYQVRYNDNDRSILSHLSSADLTKFYTALQHFQNLIKNPKNEYKFPLRPGLVVIFDNWRMLHGRNSFTGHRRLAGCYLNYDDFKSRLRVVTGMKRELC